MAGPFQQIPLDDNKSADFYLLRYDDAGRLRSPLAEQEVKGKLAEVTDVFFFAHGWNNIFAKALDRYRKFIIGYIEQRKTFAIPAAENYTPLLIGAIWPSTSFVMPWEAGPGIAAAPAPDGAEAAQAEELLGLVTSSLDPAVDAEFTEAIDGRTSIDRATAERVAAIALQALRAGSDPDDGSPAPDPKEFLEVWATLDGVTTRPAGSSINYGTVGGRHRTEPPVAAGIGFDPRSMLRVASVWKMKARAGTVGENGVGPLLDHILRHSGVRLHLIGHSFGARVVLSALASSTAERPAHSMLLLQPAVNRWCFAAKVAGTSRVGGYHSVLTKVDRPILTTFSSHDEPLTKYFHLAMRGSHLGEPGTAAIGNTDLYGALGGFGPQGMASLAVQENAAVPGKETYPLNGEARVIAVDGGVEIEGHPAIAGHGEVVNPVTWWALHALTRPD